MNPTDYYQKMIFKKQASLHVYRDNKPEIRKELEYLNKLLKDAYKDEQIHEIISVIEHRNDIPGLHKQQSTNNRCGLSLILQKT